MTTQRRGEPDLDRATHCDDVTRLVWLLLDGELTSRAAASIRLHLRECASCRAFVRFERAFLNAMRAALRGNRENRENRRNLHHEPRVSVSRRTIHKPKRGD